MSTHTVKKAAAAFLHEPYHKILFIETGAARITENQLRLKTP